MKRENYQDIYIHSFETMAITDTSVGSESCKTSFLYVAVVITLVQIQFTETTSPTFIVESYSMHTQISGKHNI